MFALPDENGDIYRPIPTASAGRQLARTRKPTSRPFLPLGRTSMSCLLPDQTRLRSLRASSGARHSPELVDGEWLATVDHPEHSRCRISGRNCPLLALRQARLALLAVDCLANAKQQRTPFPARRKEGR